MCSEINKLSDLTVLQLRTGVLYAYPLDIIQQLVENSIDANADFIKIHLYDSGYSKIIVTDNGKGISWANAQNICVIGWSSKPNYTESRSLGFRGEALACLSAIAKVEIISQSKDEQQAWCGTFIDGKLAEVKQVYSSIGTTITVHDLFRIYTKRGVIKTNVIRQATISIVAFIQKLSIIYPNIQFNVTNESSNSKVKTLFEAQPVKTSVQRVQLLYSNKVTISNLSNIPKAWGLIKDIIIFNVLSPTVAVSVNGAIREWDGLKLAIKLLLDTFHSTIKNSCLYIFVILEMPTDMIDRNIDTHKAKYFVKDEGVLINDIVDSISKLMKERMLNESPVTTSNRAASNAQSNKPFISLSRTLELTDQESVTKPPGNNKWQASQNSIIDSLVYSYDELIAAIKANVAVDLKQLHFVGIYNMSTLIIGHPTAIISFHFEKYIDEILNKCSKVVLLNESVNCAIDDFECALFTVKNCKLEKVPYLYYNPAPTVFKEALIESGTEKNEDLDVSTVLKNYYKKLILLDKNRVFGRILWELIAVHVLNSGLTLNFSISDNIKKVLKQFERC